MLPLQPNSSTFSSVCFFLLDKIKLIKIKKNQCNELHFYFEVTCALILVICIWSLALFGVD